MLNNSFGTLTAPRAIDAYRYSLRVVTPASQDVVTLAQVRRNCSIDDGDDSSERE